MDALIAKTVYKLRHAFDDYSPSHQEPPETILREAFREAISINMNKVESVSIKREDSASVASDLIRNDAFKMALQHTFACHKAILSALSLAAAVEGPEEATPETDAFVRKLEEQIRANNANNVPMQDPASQAIDAIADMERQRNAALRALKAERERTNNALLAFKEERERHAKNQVDPKDQVSAFIEKRPLTAAHLGLKKE